MALTARCFITLNQVREFLGIAGSNSNEDSKLEGWIDLICGSMEEEIENKITFQDVTNEILDGNGCVKLYPKHSPVKSVMKLETRDSYDSAWTEVSLTYLIIHPERQAAIEFIDGTVFTLGQANYRLTYVAGFDPVPAELQKVALEKVQIMWNESKQSGVEWLGKQSLSQNEAGGSLNVTLQDMNSRWKKILDRYRAIPI